MRHFRIRVVDLAEISVMPAMMLPLQSLTQLLVLAISFIRSDNYGDLFAPCKKFVYLKKTLQRFI